VLTDDQVKLIRQSAEQLSDSNVRATNAFYANLFSAAPEVRDLFPEDMFAQGEKLWSSIVTVVQSAEDLGALDDALRALGARHVAYGAQPAHYEVVAKVLLETLAALMRDEWSDAYEAAWRAVLDVVCARMLEGAA